MTWPFRCRRYRDAYKGVDQHDFTMTVDAMKSEPIVANEYSNSLIMIDKSSVDPSWTRYESHTTDFLRRDFKSPPKAPRNWLGPLLLILIVWGVACFIAGRMS